jgi:hypothetical protein
MGCGLVRVATGVLAQLLDVRGVKTLQFYQPIMIKGVAINLDVCKIPTPREVLQSGRLQVRDFPYPKISQSSGDKNSSMTVSLPVEPTWPAEVLVITQS